jgi:hypothetical protein
MVTESDYWMSEDDVPWTSILRDCVICDGTGRVYADDDDSIEIACAQCRGLGIVEVDVPDLDSLDRHWQE